MNKLIQIVLVSGLAASAVAGDVFFEAKGPVTDKTEGFRFGNITFTDNDRVCAKFEQVDYVHSGELGKQIIGRIVLEYFRCGK